MGIFLAAVAAFAAIVEAHVSADTQFKIMGRQLKVLENEQRPWVGVDASITNIGHLDDNQPSLSQYVDLVNTGKSPAFITEVEFSFGVFDEFPDDPPYSPNQAPVIRGEENIHENALVIPTGHFNTTVTFQIFNYPEVDPLLASEQTHVFVYGKVLYKDINQNEHHTHFCKVFFYPLKSKHARACKGYNDGD